MPQLVSAPLPSILTDQADRDRFATELERNFSVIAPAGVGKTTAIVARVAALAQTDARRAEPVLPRLAVVTYTRKAAEEMQARARARLLADGAGPELLGHFSQTFFGTIHSLCLLVLKNYGHLVGLPSGLEQVTQPEALWRQYLRSTDDVLHHLPQHARAPFLRHGSLANALDLVPDLPASLPAPAALPPAPVPDISAILQAPDNKRAQKNIDAGKARAEQWMRAFTEQTGHLPLPEQKTGGKDFVRTFADAFTPLCDWLGEATLILARGVAEDFRNYRKNLGQLTFDDMVSWAAMVLDHPQAGQMLRRQRWCIILDEAQDTDPTQFRILLGLSAEATAADTPDDTQGQSPPATADSPTAPLPTALLPTALLPPTPGDGRFCMVGDPQQAIYGDRADLATYLNVHRSLTDSGHAEALQFTVTMRCDRAIVATANAIFPQLLYSTRQPAQALHPAAANSRPLPLQQVDYVPLHPRPNAGPGEVSRLSLSFAEAEAEADATQDAAPDSSTKRKGDSDRLSAAALARTLASHGPQAFGVEDWSQIAILCVRNAPLAIIAEALEAEGLPVQNHSRLDIRGDSPAYAWFAALVRIIAEPQDAFEVAGVLREVFGLADGVLYEYTRAAGSGAAAGANKGSSESKPWHPLALSYGALALSNPTDDPTVGARATQYPGSTPQAVGEALGLLRQVRAQVVGLPLREGAHLLSKRLQLPERLASLPDGRTRSHLQQLEDLLLQAASYEEQGFDWLQWADALRDGFDARPDSAEPLKGHLQLLSCHKSKGLQWPVVLLANLFRTVGYARANFPRLLFPNRSEPPCVAFASGHGHSEVEARLKLKSAQELQRLAYVACTRAQRSMVWVDDGDFYDKPDGSFAAALGIDTPQAVNAATWAALPPWQPRSPDATTAEATASAAIASGPQLSLQAAAQERPRWGEAFASTLAKAGEASPQPFFRRILPSSLADHTPRRVSTSAADTSAANTSATAASHAVDDSAHSGTRRGHARNEPDGSRTLPAFAELEEAAAATAGADYGNWWHRTMELAPWGKPEKNWTHYGETALATCPDLQRGLQEWEQYLDSPLHTWLNRPEVIVRCELPLLWPDAMQSIAYDGFIDLVARDSSRNTWLLVDWKTDRLHAFADPAAELLRCYGPQLEAYRKALSAMFGTPVRGYLYNTPSGQCSPAFTG